MADEERMVLRRSDHDTIIRLDENVKNLLFQFNTLAPSIAAIDGRVKALELSGVKTQEILTEIIDLKNKVNKLDGQRNMVMGGWKTVLILVGALSGLLNIGLVIFSNLHK